MLVWKEKTLAMRGTTGKESNKEPGQPSAVNGDTTTIKSHGDGDGNLKAITALQEISVLDLLEQEQRPTFIVDLTDAMMLSEKRLQLSYSNPSMRALPDLQSFLTQPQSLSATSVRFVNWVLAPTRHDGSLEPMQLSYTYGGFTWSAATLKRRWRVISGSPDGGVNSLTEDEDDSQRVKASEDPPQVDGSAPVSLPRHPLLRVRQSTGSSPTIKRSTTAWLDWTRTPTPHDMSDHVRLIRSVDWAATTLGPVDSWSDHLRHMCLLLIANPNPAVIFWGPELPNLTMVYNEAYVPLVASKHPQLMGQCPEDGFPEAYRDLKPLIAEVYHTATASYFEDMVLFLDRGSGSEEESCFCFTLLPIIGLNDTVVGILQTVVETTKQKVTQRRLSTLLSIGQSVAAAQDMRAFWHGLLEALKSNPHDFPFALLYSVVEELDTGTDAASTTSSLYSGYKRLGLEGTVGIPTNHPAAVTFSEITQGREGFTACFPTAAKMKEPMLLRTEDGSLSESLVRGLEPRGFGDQCKVAVICPIHPTTGLASASESPLAFLIMGLSSRRPYDDDYKNFIQLLARQVTTSMASVLLREEEIRRGRTLAEQAAMDQAKLEEQIAVQAKELEHSELKLKRFADCIPAGIFVIDYSTNPLGSYAYRNDKWFELTNDPREDLPAWQSPLWKTMAQEDAPRVREEWNRVLQGFSASIEFRIPRSTSRKPEPPSEYTWTWILCDAYPLKEAGKLKTVIGCITDITKQKWAESVQKRRMEDARIQTTTRAFH